MNAFGRLVNGERARRSARAVATARDERRLRERRAGVQPRARAPRAVGEPPPTLNITARRARVRERSVERGEAAEQRRRRGAGRGAARKRIDGSEGIYGSEERELGGRALPLRSTKTGVRAMEQALAAGPLLERDGRRAFLKIAADAELHDAREERGVGFRRWPVVAPAVRLENTPGAICIVAEAASCDERRPQELLDGLALVRDDLDIEGFGYVPQDPIFEDPVRERERRYSRIEAPRVLREA